MLTIVLRLFTGRVQEVLDCWSELEMLETVSQMHGNASKTQVWSLNNPQESGVVLGCILSDGEAVHGKELERITAVHKIASRINLLPCSVAIRLSALMLLLRCFPAKQFGTITHDPSAWRMLFRKACVGGQNGGRASRHLEFLARWGHRGDVSFLATQRLLATLNSWWDRVGENRPQPMPHLKVVDRVNQELRRLSCPAEHWGVWRHTSGLVLDIRASPSLFGKMLHLLRESWRSCQFNAWVQNRNRRDSALARELNLQYSEQLGALLKGLVKRIFGDAAAVLVGGMSTPATVRHALRPLCCPYCHAAVVPCVDHVLWVCPPFAARRVLPRPVSAFAARLGWEPGRSLDSSAALLFQMGVIRHEEHTLRRQTLQAPLPEELA